MKDVKEIPLAKRGAPKRRLPMKKLSLLLAVLLLATALYPLPVVAAPSGVSEITLTAQSYSEEGHRVYTNARQIEMLLSYLPTEQQRLSSFIPSTGGIGAEMRFVRDGVEERWFFTGDYVFRNFPGGTARPYEGNPGAWRLLLAMAGFRRGLNAVAPGFINPEGYTFHGEVVTEILLLNGAERLCKSFSGTKTETQALLAALEPLEPSTTGGQMGAHVFTDKGRFSYYFRKDDPGEAARIIWEQAIDKPYWNVYLASPQWLSWIDPAQVTSVSYYGGGGRGDAVPLSLETVNPQAITEIVSYVKELSVVPGSCYEAEEELPFEKDSYRLELQCGSGFTMWVDGRTDTLTIGATELSRELTYQIEPETHRVLREFFALQAAGISK
jgi:hypothetical protein